jgi:hypothetical protein
MDKWNEPFGPTFGKRVTNKLRLNVQGVRCCMLHPIAFTTPYAGKLDVLLDQIVTHKALCEGNYVSTK